MQSTRHIAGRISFHKMLIEALGRMDAEKMAEVNVAHVRWVSRFERQNLDLEGGCKEVGVSVRYRKRIKRTAILRRRQPWAEGKTVEGHSDDTPKGKEDNSRG